MRAAEDPRAFGAVVAIGLRWPRGGWGARAELTLGRASERPRGAPSSGVIDVAPERAVRLPERSRDAMPVGDPQPAGQAPRATAWALGSARPAALDGPRSVLTYAPPARAGEAPRLRLVPLPRGSLLVAAA